MQNSGQTTFVLFGNALDPRGRTNHPQPASPRPHRKPVAPVLAKNQPVWRSRPSKTSVTGRTPGIFVLTGKAAANYAAPAISLSFVLSGVACAFVGLCYAELAAMIPASGSAYTYAYATVGEIFAWIIGWDLILEYAMGASTVAVGWSGYFVSLLNSFGIH